LIENLWLVKDCCGLICAAITWLLIGYAEFVVIFVILLPSPNEVHSIINGTIFEFFAALAFLSHLRAMTTDPVSLLP
jgi:palmitoyltransferase ZDHHC3/7/25